MGTRRPSWLLPVLRRRWRNEKCHNEVRTLVEELRNEELGEDRMAEVL